MKFPGDTLMISLLRNIPSSFHSVKMKKWDYLRSGLKKSEDFLDFALTTHATSWDEEKGFTWDDSGCRTECSLFGFKISVKQNSSFTRTDLAKILDINKIGNRMLFGGNLIRQPAFVELKKNRPEVYRTAVETEGSDKIMEDTLFLGTYPGLTKEMMDFEINTINNFVFSDKKS